MGAQEVFLCCLVLVGGIVNQSVGHIVGHILSA